MGKYIYDNGYMNLTSAFTDDITFTIVLGGRGIGKTYSAIKWLCENCNSDNKFIYCRRTQSEIDVVNKGNLYADFNNFKIEKSDYISEVTDNGETVGYHTALSSISHIRGIPYATFENVKFIYFDEFIPDIGVSTRKHQGELFLNMYETINRNRELEGHPAVKCLLTSNYNRINDSILEALGVQQEIESLKNAYPIGIKENQDIRLIVVNYSNISELKKETVLYRINHSQVFSDMAISNTVHSGLADIIHLPYTEYRYIGTLAGIAINELKNTDKYNYYLTESSDYIDPSRKNLLKYVNVYQAFNAGRVAVQKDYLAYNFYNIYNL